MAKYLIDVNLPYYFGVWNTPDYIHQNDLGADKSDKVIWEYAIRNHLTIISKDSDFSNRILLKEPPPRVIHIRLGNMHMKDFHDTISRCWEEVLEISMQYKLVNVFKDKIEGIQ